MYYNDYNRPPEDYMDPAPTPAPPPPEPAPVKKKHPHLWLKVTAVCLVCVLLGSAAGITVASFLAGSGMSAGGSTTLYRGDRTPTVVDIAEINTGSLLTATEIYASNLESVVGITTQISTNSFGQTVSQAASGSGFVISSDGYILTNYHVIEDATSITVSFASGETYEAVLVGGVDENDIAVLKIGATGLRPVVLGRSSDMRVGEWVGAIGHPLGELTYTMTQGYVSALDRNITMSDGTVMNMLQTDCAINSGNSGGPLFNSYGEVIGITTAKYSSNSYSSVATIEGIGFVIPIDDVAHMVTDIIAHGYVTGQPFMGMLVYSVTSDAQQYYNMPAGGYVSGIAEGYAADKAGLQVGDIITAVNGNPITSSADIITERDKCKPGDTITLTVVRNRETLELELTMDELTPEGEAALNEVEESLNRNQNSQNPSSQYGGGYYYDWPFFDFGW